ncbi:hypothetical protein Drorol1_Dr00015940 [Drosera rotundifolia]
MNIRRNGETAFGKGVQFTLDTLNTDTRDCAIVDLKGLPDLLGRRTMNHLGKDSIREGGGQPSQNHLVKAEPSKSTHNPQSQKEERLKDMNENNRDAKDQESSCKVVEIRRKDVQLEFGTLLSNFYRLSIDVMGSLGTQLKIMDYLSFRSVCKEFHAASPLPIPIDQRNHTSSSPWLMFFKNDELTCNLVDSIQNSWYLVTIPPELLGGRIMFSNKDEVIICKGRTFCHFYHPFTKVKVTMELPPYVSKSQRIASSSIPTLPGSVTIAILNSALHIGIHRLLSTDKELRFSLLANEISFYLGHNSLVFCDGTFYLLDQIGSLGLLKLTDDEPEWEILNRPQGLESIYGTYQVECDGQLLEYVGRF